MHFVKPVALELTFLSCCQSLCSIGFSSQTKMLKTDESMIQQIRYLHLLFIDEKINYSFVIGSNLKKRTLFLSSHLIQSRWPLMFYSYRIFQLFICLEVSHKSSFGSHERGVLANVSFIGYK